MSNEAWETKNESHDCRNTIIDSNSSSIDEDLFSSDAENKSIENCRRSEFVKQFSEIIQASKNLNPNLFDLNRKFHALKDEAMYLKSADFFKWRGRFYYEIGLALKGENDLRYIKLYKKALGDYQVALNLDFCIKKVKDWKLCIEKELREQSLGMHSALLFKSSNGLNNDQLVTQEKIYPKIR